MGKVVFVNKPVSISPLQAIDQFRRMYPEYETEKISYAGRLDPMAEGLLMLLIGDENQNRNQYENLNKVYETEVIFGISTDTFDQLGIIENITYQLIEEKKIINNLKKFVGIQDQIYPPYSSKAVDGKPLYWWARNKKLVDMNLPKNQIEIFDIKLISHKNIMGSEIYDKVLNNIKKLKGDFRQEEILKAWGEFNSKYANTQFIIIKMQVECSKGTYIRRLASDLGISLGSNAIAISIKRIKIGSFSLSDAIYLE